jgi:hypothetical protein
MTYLYDPLGCKRAALAKKPETIHRQIWSTSPVKYISNNLNYISIKIKNKNKYSILGGIEFRMNEGITSFHATHSTSCTWMEGGAALLPPFLHHWLYFDWQVVIQLWSQASIQTIHSLLFCSIFNSLLGSFYSTKHLTTLLASVCSFLWKFISRLD